MKTKKLFLISAAVLAATSLTAFAAAYATPAEAVAALTGRTVDSVVEERTETNKTYGEIAAEAGVLDSYRDEVLEIKKERLDELVTDGTITQERADEILAAMETAQETCDGTGGRQIGKTYGVGFGAGSCGNENCALGYGEGLGTNAGAGNRLGDGSGLGQNAGGRGQGCGLQSGSCIY